MEVPAAAGVAASEGEVAWEVVHVARFLLHQGQRPLCRRDPSDANEANVDAEVSWVEEVLGP